MTEYAIPGVARRGLPDGIEDWEGGLEPVTLPWLCPVCGEVVAETFVSSSRPDRGRTVVVGFSPTRQPEGDRDGVPFFGPSRRAMRGKSERHTTTRLANTSWLRARGADRGPDAARPPYAVDHAPIDLKDFETVCIKCPVRVHIRLPSE